MKSIITLIVIIKLNNFSHFIYYKLIAFINMYNNLKQYFATLDNINIFYFIISHIHISYIQYPECSIFQSIHHARI